MRAAALADLVEMSLKRGHSARTSFTFGPHELVPEEVVELDAILSVALEHAVEEALELRGRAARDAATKRKPPSAPRSRDTQVVVELGMSPAHKWETVPTKVFTAFTRDASGMPLQPT